ncbi:MAG: ATP-binding cassette domain-containing protein [Actinomycetes bacterium]|jgi:ABC-2 type transport system ATP-binding protein|nr:ATP-binding cassette domain-containing protein [Actinomycetes bacterium]
MYEPEVVLETHNLNKDYRRTRALSDINIALDRGRIYGLVGQNGAGKTTLMRIIAGLSQPTQGSITLFGASSQPSLVRARRRLGAIIETPALYPDLSAAQNLEIERLIRGVADRSRVKRLLQQVGLDGTGRKRVRDFSLGMRQRLAIAVALLADPALLLLDEPINGLDPMGIIQVRQLLTTLAHEHGCTILISSHILSELDQLADEYLFVSDGRIIKQLTAAELSTQHDNLEGYFLELLKEGTPQ